MPRRGHREEGLVSCPRPEAVVVEWCEESAGCAWEGRCAVTKKELKCPVQLSS